jgi:hypothetical protein
MIMLPVIRLLCLSQAGLIRPEDCRHHWPAEFGRYIGIAREHFAPLRAGD